jgi:hypothetical protein
MGDRILRWFYGLPNIVGTVLALVGLALFLGGVINGWLVPLIVLGLYALGAVVTPRPRAIGGGLTGSGGELDSRQIESELKRIVSQAEQRLPNELAAKVAAIQGTILDLLPRINASSIDRRDLFALERTVAEYLPQTLNNYLTLPRVYADSHAVAGGKTPRKLLAGQLDLIEEKMQAISEAVAKDDVDKLLAQGRFLEERFGKNTELALPRTSEQG